MPEENSDDDPLLHWTKSPVCQGEKYCYSAVSLIKLKTVSFVRLISRTAGTCFSFYLVKKVNLVTFPLKVDAASDAAPMCARFPRPLPHYLSLKASPPSFGFLFVSKTRSLNFQAHTVFVDAFLHNNRLEHMIQVMGYHPLYLQCFLTTEHYMLHGDGPLPFNYRHYIAIMVSTQ